ncbi:MAG: DUF3611 family protein [Cyanobacteria bacterium SBLK]|nr:DUF3611 family protein [Cyanobacteria bacterium SBLK]
MSEKKRGELASSTFENGDSAPAPVPQKVRQAAADLKWAGQIGFWVQLVLGVISTVTVLFASSSFIGPDNTANTQGTELGVFSAILGLIALGISVYYSYRYMAIAKMLQNPNSSQRPNRADTIKVIRAGLVVNLVGMLLTIIGAEANVGLVLAKALANPPGAFSNLDARKLVNSIDLLVIQANTNTIAAHFSGIVSSLLLLNRITR